MKPLKTIDKQALEDWDAYLKSIRKDTAVDLDMPYEERQKRLTYLEKHPLLWIKEMFPNYAKYEFASFHKKAIKRLIYSPKNWYEVLSWARELAKSTVVMFVVLFLVLTGKKRNIILCSNSLDNAIKLLAHYRAQLEANQRIQFYYGDQKGFKWTEDNFITKGGASFMAVGARQSPRGVKIEEVRPDTILVDDYDTDEECRNPEIVNDKWNWFEQALYFTRSFSEPLLTIFWGTSSPRTAVWHGPVRRHSSYPVGRTRSGTGTSSTCAWWTSITQIPRTISPTGPPSGRRRTTRRRSTMSLHR